MLITDFQIRVASRTAQEGRFYQVDSQTFTQKNAEKKIHRVADLDGLRLCLENFRQPVPAEAQKPPATPPSATDRVDKLFGNNDRGHLWFEIEFDRENRLRVLEGRNPVNRNQFRRALENRLP